MKFGKIYTYENRDEAMKLIGKKVFASDSLVRVHNPTTMFFMLVYIDLCNAEHPFRCKLLDYDFNFQFIREVIEEEKEEPKLMTNRHLAEWLAKGNGERKLREDEPVSNALIYYEDDENLPVGEDVVIRPWDSDEWVKPTVDIYERDCKA